MGIVSFQLVGSFLWLLIEPPGTTIIFPTRTEAVLTCKVSLHYKQKEKRIKATAAHLMVSLSYNLLLIVACTVYAFKTRKIPENFNETRHIGFTMYSTCILWLSFMPIYFATQNNFRVCINSLTVQRYSDSNYIIVHVRLALRNRCVVLFLCSQSRTFPLN